jgi:hypothetical protein
MEDWEVDGRLGVQATLSRYTRFVDSGRARELARLFTEKCHYDMGADRIITDRDGIEPAVEEIKATFRDAKDFGRLRHHVSSVVIELLDVEHATVTSYFTAMAAWGPDHWGVYRDELVRIGDDWLFARRVVTVEGAVPQSPVAPTTA